MKSRQIPKKLGWLALGLSCLVGIWFLLGLFAINWQSGLIGIGMLIYVTGAYLYKRSQKKEKPEDILK